MNKQLYPKYDDSSYFKLNKESDFQREIKKDLKEKGLLVIKMPSSLEKGLVLPDLLCIFPRTDERFSCAFFLELKTPTGRLQKIQEVTFAFLKKYIGVYVIKGWADYYSLLEYLGIKDVETKEVDLND